MFKQRKNKKFNYRARYQKDDASDGRGNLESKWNKELMSSNKHQGTKLSSFPVLIVLFIMVLILMYVLNTYIE